MIRLKKSSKQMNQIKADVLADEVILDKVEGYTADWKINGEAVTLGVTKVEA